MKAIVVLGMHRSATSMTSRALHNSNEVYMGHKLATASQPDNLKGHYEHVPVVWLNDEILKLAGGNWLNPPSREAILEVGKRRDIKEKIKKEIEEIKINAIKNNSTSYGFKDPRACLTIELYHPYLDYPQYIVPFKNHEEIAKSLVKRGDGVTTIEQGIKLSEIYYTRIIKFIQSNF